MNRKEVGNEIFYVLSYYLNLNLSENSYITNEILDKIEDAGGVFEKEEETD